NTQMPRARPPLGMADLSSVEALLTVDLKIDHRSEGGEELVEARGIAFQSAERHGEGLDGRDRRPVRLLPDAVLAWPRRNERVARHPGEEQTFAHDLLRLWPGAIDDDQRHGVGRGRANDVDGPFARVKKDGASTRIG